MVKARSGVFTACFHVVGANTLSINELSGRTGAASSIDAKSLSGETRGVRVRRGKDQNADGESGEDSISNSPQGECYIKLSGGGGGATALHTTNRVKNASGGNAHWRAMWAESWRKVFIAVRFWVETNEIKLYPVKGGFCI